MLATATVSTCLQPSLRQHEDDAARLHLNRMSTTGAEDSTYAWILGIRGVRARGIRRIRGNRYIEFRGIRKVR